MSVQLLVLSLTSCASYAYQTTCPFGITGCETTNTCTSCHESCGVYCQCLTGCHGTTCGIQDCMTCATGDTLTVLYPDGTGSCHSSNTLSYQATCPSNITGCSTTNTCTTCHETCGEYCQCTGCRKPCGIHDCMTCPIGYTLNVMFPDGTGSCTADPTTPPTHATRLPTFIYTTGPPVPSPTPHPTVITPDPTNGTPNPTSVTLARSLMSSTASLPPVPTHGLTIKTSVLSTTFPFADPPRKDGNTRDGNVDEKTYASSLSPASTVHDNTPYEYDAWLLLLVSGASLSLVCCLTCIGWLFLKWKREMRHQVTIVITDVDNNHNMNCIGSNGTTDIVMTHTNEWSQDNSGANPELISNIKTQETTRRDLTGNSNIRDDEFEVIGDDQFTQGV